MRGILTALCSQASSLRGDARGIAAVEFALIALMLILAIMNVADIGYFTYTRMEVENAAEMGAQQAWKTCNNVMAMLPATTKCSGLNAAITTAIQGTSLGTNVSLANGSPSEAYYCVNGSNALQSVGTVANPPSDCSAAGNANASPGDYLLVSVTYSYTPLFPGITVMSATGISAITMTSWMRMG